jgi:hypothetical protein
MIRKVLAIGTVALIGGLGACGGGTTYEAETVEPVLVPASRPVPVYQEVEVESPDEVEIETPDEPSPDIEYEIEVDD